MLKNNLLIAFRNLWKNKVITVINVFGLSVGLACFALFSLYVLNERCFDRFHAKSDRLFAVCQATGSFHGQPPRKSNYLPMPLGPALEADLPDVARFARLQGMEESFVRTAKGVVKERLDCADPAFFEMFSFPFLYGDATSALASPGNVVLTEKMAQKLFGEANPVGKVLEIKVEKEFEPFTVSGVVQNIPSNSSLTFGILLPFARFAATKEGRESAERWHRFSMQTFVELRDGSGLSADTARMAQFFLKYYPDDEKELRADGTWNQPGPPITFAFLPLRALHQDAELGGGNAKLTWILLAIGGIILLIACINFTTLAIGRSAGRAREIGVRKVVGASRGQLSRQFLTEAILLSGFSTVAGVALAIGLLPLFNQLADKDLAFDMQQFPELWALVPGLALLAGGLAGSYPAFVLSGFSPLETLKSKLKIGGENWFTKSLVTFQFVLSVGLMICTLVMLRQLNFLRGQNPGFDRENVVVLNAEGTTDPAKILARFRRSLDGRPEIVGISGAMLSLGARAGYMSSGFDYQGKNKQVFEYFIDDQYLKVLNLQLLAGRNFDPNVTLDSVTSVIINASAARDFGWTNAGAIGQVLTGYNEHDPSRNPVVIGVVRDYNFLSLREKVQPMMFTMFRDYAPLQFFVRIAPGDPHPALEQLRTAWTAAEPVLPLRYVFLDENLQKFYTSEANISKIIGLAGGIAILLACLGLFGLAALSTLNRTKEIGIRKVLGASVAGITGLLARDFLKLVLVAIVIASPLAYYFMQRWLADFAYHVEIQAWMFALAGIMAVAIAFLTVGFQSVKAALANPVESLRSE